MKLTKLVRLFEQKTEEIKEGCSVVDQDEIINELGQAAFSAIQTVIQDQGTEDGDIQKGPHPSIAVLSKPIPSVEARKHQCPFTGNSSDSGHL